MDPSLSVVPSYLLLEERSSSAALALHPLSLREDHLEAAQVVLNFVICVVQTNGAYL
jgi:hypothetical protein